jgi:hypothetical protein
MAKRFLEKRASWKAGIVSDNRGIIVRFLFGPRRCLTSGLIGVVSLSWTGDLIMMVLGQCALLDGRLLNVGASRRARLAQDAIDGIVRREKTADLAMAAIVTWTKVFRPWNGRGHVKVVAGGWW